MVLGGGGAGVGVEDAVVMELAPGDGEDNVITVNCPDQAGLGSDLCRTILEFGLRITRGGEPLPSTFDLCPQLSFLSFSSSIAAACSPLPRPASSLPRTPTRNRDSFVQSRARIACSGRIISPGIVRRVVVLNLCFFQKIIFLPFSLLWVLRCGC